MSRRYTYSRTINTPEGRETFTADQFDSFDEARNAVEKGVRDRRAQFPQIASLGATVSDALNPPQRSLGFGDNDKDKKV